MVSIHTGEGSVHMIIIAWHVIIMSILHTCAGLADRPTTEVNRVSRVHLYVFTVEVLNTACPNATGDLETTGNNHIAHPTLWEGTSHPILKFQEIPLVVHLLQVLIHMGVYLSPNVKGPILKIWEIQDQINRPSQSSRNTNYNYDYRELQRQPYGKVWWKIQPEVLTPCISTDPITK